MTPLIQVRDLVAGYGRRAALRDVSFQVDAGKRVAIIGPNGSGKTTLFRVLLGVLPPWRGTVDLYGQPVGRLNRREHSIAYLPQVREMSHDFPVSARDVVLMGRIGRLGVFHRPGKEDHRRVTDAIEQVGLTEFADRSFGALSGGQQQRMLLARALATDARIILLDEPANGLDQTTSALVSDIIDVLTGEGRAVLVSTHDLTAANLNRYHWLIALQGEVVAQGAPAEVVQQDPVRRLFPGLAA